MDLKKGSGGIMLIQFRFKNHRCFYDETVLDLSATSEKRHLEDTLKIESGKLLPVISIHGANASGKTTILEALCYMFSMVKNSLRIDIEKDILTKPFIFSESARKDNSEYEVSLYFDSYEYRYGFVLNSNSIVEEWLYIKKSSTDSRVNETCVFERHNDEVHFDKKYSKYDNIWKLFTGEVSSSKLLVLSHVASKDENGFFRKIYNYMSNFIGEIDSEKSREMSIRILKGNTDIDRKFQEIIKEFDPCLLGVRIEAIESDDKKQFKISGIHKDVENPRNKLLIPFNDESFGTLKIFNIIPAILVSLEQGTLLCVDELDVKLHPLLFRKIVNMYNDKSININNAQLIFTAHSTFLFNSNDMRRDQIYLVEKNKMGQSKLFSLSDFKNLRIDTDYEKKYLSGQFGAIPFIDE